MKNILGKTMEEWIRKYPIIDDIRALKETVWINPDADLSSESIRRNNISAAKCMNEGQIQSAEIACVFNNISDFELTFADVLDANARLRRFAPYIEEAFPETKVSHGIIESPLKQIPEMKMALEERGACHIPGSLWIKLDSHLPISGSIKARGGIYEVLKFAEDVALKHGLLNAKDAALKHGLLIFISSNLSNHPKDNFIKSEKRVGEKYREIFTSKKFKEIAARYSIAVGSTGNLGLSIGIMGAKLGFKVTVHMSADAKKWKKDLLRSKGVSVVEYDADYSAAVREGRKVAETDPLCHFIDDENSKTLFLGYSVAALRLKKQFEEKNITVDKAHPLFVYLPCGVGGGPGGVAFGLKLAFGDAAHCFFAEPVHSPCMMLGLVTGLNNLVSVQDFGIDNKTIADGLAVGRPSGFVGKFMRPLISGCFTLSDERMLEFLRLLADSEGIYLEPSALAGMYGPVLAAASPMFKKYLKDNNLSEVISSGTHLVWATGGSMVPKDEMRKYLPRV